jgi:hypothetical protein
VDAQNGGADDDGARQQKNTQDAGVPCGIAQENTQQSERGTGRTKRENALAGERAVCKAATQRKMNVWTNAMIARLRLVRMEKEFMTN